MISIVNIKTTPEFKALLMKQAQSRHRSMSGYLKWLVYRDAELPIPEPETIPVRLPDITPPWGA